MSAANLRLEDFLTTEDNKRAGRMVKSIVGLARNADFRHELIERYFTAGVLGRRRLCMLYAAIGTSDVLVKLGEVIVCDEWGAVRATAIKATHTAGIEKFTSELLWAASCDRDPSVRSAAEQMLYIHGNIDAIPYDDESCTPV